MCCILLPCRWNEMFGFFVQTVHSRLGLIIYRTLVPHMFPHIPYNPPYLRLIPLHPHPRVDTITWWPDFGRNSTRFGRASLGSARKQSVIYLDLQRWRSTARIVFLHTIECLKGTCEALVAKSAGLSAVEEQGDRKSLPPLSTI